MPPTLGWIMNDNEKFNYALSSLEALESHAESMMNLNRWMAALRSAQLRECRLIGI